MSKHQGQSEKQQNQEDRLQQQHDQWMKREPTSAESEEFDRYFEFWCAVGQIDEQIHELEHGPCSDVATKQKRIEELQVRRSQLISAGLKEIPALQFKPSDLYPEGFKERGFKDEARIYARGLVNGNPQITLEELTVETAEAIRFPGDQGTVRDYIRDIHPGYSPGKPGRKKKIRS